MSTTDDILKDIAESLRGLPELVEALRENTASREMPVQRDRLDEAILAMVKLKKPSQRAIAEAIGLKSHSSLKDIEGFLDIWDKWQMMLSIKARPSRSCIHRRDSDHTLSDEVY